MLYFELLLNKLHYVFMLSKPDTYEYFYLQEYNVFFRY